MPLIAMALAVAIAPASASASPATWNHTGAVLNGSGFAPLKFTFTSPTAQKAVFDCSRSYTITMGTTANTGSPLNGTLTLDWRAPVQYDCTAASPTLGRCTVLPQNAFRTGLGNASQVGGVYSVAFPSVPNPGATVSCAGLIGQMPAGGASITGAWSNATSTLTLSNQVLGVSSTGWTVSVDASSEPLQATGGLLALS